MTCETLWIKTKEQLKNSLPDHAFNTWFEPVTAIALSDDELVLEVPNQFFFEWLKSHYHPVLDNAVKKIAQSNVSIKYTVSTSVQDAVPYVQERFSDTPPQKGLKSSLNTKYLFGNYIEGKNNQFAKAAAMTVAENLGHEKFNPLVVYGGVGLGKTHLIHAIGNKVKADNPNARVVLAASETFTRDFISSIRKNKTTEFAKTYRKADVLLIDDIQFFQGKEQTQEQFFHTFNELYQSGKQIVLTADRYPGELEGLIDRLLSRFESGLSVDIQPPPFETRVAILMEKSDENGVELPYNLVEFIATHIKTSIRDLESTIIRLLAYSSLSNKEIDQKLVKKVVQERIGKRLVSEMTVEDIVKRVSEISKISEKDIVGSSRKKEIAEARHMSIYLAREILKLPLASIGLHFGGRDHTTVLHACKVVEKRAGNDERTGKTLSLLKQQLLVSAA